MTIRNRLTVLFTAGIAGLLLFFSLVIYWSLAKDREDEYYNLLHHTAITKANLLLDAKVTPSVLQLIYRNAENTLFQEEVAIYNTSFHLLYHDAVEIDKVKETPQMIHQIITDKEIRFYQGSLQVVGFLYRHKGQLYVITAAADDRQGYAKLNNLVYTLIITFFVVIILTYFASQFFALKALQPVADMVKKVEVITATNLDLRLNEGNGKDEITELAVTFNAMLNRLERSFDAQKEFVSNISHELRTPLTAMLTELQVTIEKERDNLFYKESIAHAISDGQKLVRLSNSLLDLAKANYDQTKISFRRVRLDEVLLDARSDVLHNHPSFKVNMVFEKDIDDEQQLTLMGNTYLLKVAMMNLIENGCKFSSGHECNVSISYNDTDSIIHVHDNGVGIAEADQQNIFNAFYRSESSQHLKGNGIGLSLSKKIIELHQGTINVHSVLGEGTTFTVKLPHQ
ncbi:sensor histidine kinase [Mucilaginibacter sp. KACC 22063]|uniref:sensor histidine kinase n=1 Tax=Mucilaginibacter sp. KACC 22063 TaxID=3025666 RepID=UPI00236722D8|nr:HAMP domain-containing sensor histidine kinase [Mucilaginibacter sp. KACC 22063]WDF54167.1 HAMP domain-containing sensor histidine kinase [Mucilaginibacter sp. KACC 22063]